MGADSLQVLLSNLRVKKNEVQLTRCFCELSNSDPGVGRGLATALLRAASRQADIGDRAEQLLDALPEKCTWHGEQQARDLRPRARRHKSRDGRIDWLTEARTDAVEKPLFLLGTEVKVDAPLINPLKTYYGDLQNRAAAAWGLLVLARNRPPEIDLLSPSDNGHWLGVALWRDVIAELRHVRPHDEALTHVWPTLLAVLSQDDDLGAAPITIADLSGESSKRKTVILLENAAAPAEAAIRAALEHRGVGNQTGRDFVYFRTSTRATRSARLVGFMDPDDQDPAIEFDLTPQNPDLALTTRIRPLRPHRLARPKTRSEHQRAEAALQALTPAFQREGESLIRNTPVAQTTGDLIDDVANAVVSELEAIGATGILDHEL